jgi:hypothetical protein
MFPTLSVRPDRGVGRHDIPMSRSLNVIFSVVLVVAGAAGALVCGVLLAQQGLDRAEKWVSITVGITSVVVAVTGVWLAWLTWRRTANTSTSVSPVHAGGTGAVALWGNSAGQITTNVSGVPMPPAPAPLSDTAGVNAAGAGSVAIGGNSTAPIRTKITGPAATP